MAQLQENASVNSKGSKAKRKKHSVYIDLTPMVDLGFLLITFFIFTTSMVTQKSLPIDFPPIEKPEVPNGKPTKESTVMNLILDSNNVYHYYIGLDVKKMQTLNSTQLLLNKVAQHQINIAGNRSNGIYKKSDSAMLIIKPSSFSNVQNLISAIDAVAVGKVEQYTIGEVNEDERKVIWK